MKILIIGPAYPYRGGIADTNESLCRALIKSGHDASILTFTLQYPKFLFPGKTQYSDDAKPQGLEVVRKVNTVNPLNWFQTARYINGTKPDLVIVRYWTPMMAPSLGTIVKKLNKKIKTVALCDNVIPHERKLWDRTLTKYFVRSFDGFLTFSDSTQKELGMFTDKPKEFYPHPINDNLGEKVDMEEARAYLKLNKNDKYLLFFGLVRDYKGLDLTIKALGEECLKNQDVKLLIAGEFYESEEKYRSLIAEYKLEERVEIINKFIPLSDIKYYFSGVDLVVQTYKTATQSGVSQIAYNFECPILVTDVGGLSEIILHEKTGYVTQKDPKNIAKHIERFFLNDLRDSFSVNMKQEKKKYQWSSFCNIVEELYKKL